MRPLVTLEASFHHFPVSPGASQAHATREDDIIYASWTRVNPMEEHGRKGIGWVIAVIFFTALAVTVTTWTASLTVDFVGSVLPELPMAPWLALAVFDAGMWIWALVFIYMAAGIWQKGIAIVMSVFCIIGVGVMSLSELFLGGQNYTLAPEGLGTISVWVIGVWTFISVAAICAFHLADPETQRKMAVREEQDETIKAGLAEYRSQMGRNRQKLASAFGEEMYSRAVNMLSVTKTPPAKLAPTDTPPTGQSRQCAGITGSGIRCKKMVVDGDFCPQHKEQA